MNKATPRITDGIIGLSMLLMLTVAIVAGQARANLGAELQQVVEVQQSSHRATRALSLHDIKRLEALPTIAETLLELPFHIVIDAETGLLTATRIQPLVGHE
jgi:hypothetical protein